MTEKVEEASSNEPFWKELKRLYMKQFKNECNLQAYELGLESSVAVYIITRFGLKRPQSAFKYSFIALSCVPLIYWPICTAQKKSELKP